MTRSPTFTSVTVLPTAMMSPAASLPGVKGTAGLCWYLPCTVRMSVKFTAAARMRTRASLDASEGSSISCSFSVAMSSLISRQTMAFTPCPFSRRAVAVSRVL